MLDVLFVLMTAVFFAAAAAFVHVCDRIVGADETTAVDDGAASDERVAA